ncbi:hypothetical protein J437_LFUL004205 [Ladona fulva]|uniref:LIM zinc-binding domain-containing protein n=1 Tax=Ladona fulva TaxID=123851 RepID=A0A8K0JXY1_LADFU|nr:hypothetical protein J437_LFUL004205 [Ladona fulva]
MNTGMDETSIVTSRPICSDCNQEIMSNGVFALSKMWHPEHFKCNECQKPITTDKFYEKDGHPYCENDFNSLFQVKCAKCKDPINDQSYINALNKTWHTHHFFCTECEKPLVGSTYMEKESNPYCELDYHKLFTMKCDACNEPITDFKMVALGKNWHKDCLACQMCKKNVPMVIVEEKAICYDCMIK